MWQKLKNIYHGFNALAAALYYRYPSKSIKVIGITGTDGKTTTTHLIHHILIQAGKKASMVSTVYAEIAGKQYDTGFHVTTPDSWMLQKFLREAVIKGEEYIVLEVTSHGLDQNRVAGIDFNIGVVTNVTHEHLDYHKDYLSYFKTKEKLIKRAKVAIVNRDDESYNLFYIANKRTISYGLRNSADVTIRSFPFTTQLPGEYNKYNCLAAIAVCKQIGIKDEDIRKGLKSFTGVKGRFEKIANKRGIDIIIDFAHTPNALKQVLSTVKPMVKGRLIHVFGAAGLRDVSKRSFMGTESAKFADLIVLTEEDCRTEDVNQIIDQIALGCINQGAKELQVRQIGQKFESPVFFRIPGRLQAINFAINKLAKKGDTVILTGKAHEKSLCRGKVEYPWSEHEAVKQAISY